MTASIALDREYSFSTRDINEVPYTNVDIGAITAMSCDTQTQTIVPVTRRVMRGTQSLLDKSTHGSEGISGFIDGQLERFTDFAEFVEGRFFDGESGEVDYAPSCSGAVPHVKSHNRIRSEVYSRHVYRLTVGSGALEKKCIGSAPLIRETNFFEANRCTRADVLGQKDYQGMQDYDGPRAARPPINYQPINPRSPTGNIDIIVYGTNNVLSPYIFNNKPEDAVLLRLDPTGMGESKPVFRDYVANDFLYVIEASPYGEIFFAERDLSKLIHEPVKSGIQRFLPPPNLNIRTVEAAIWL